MIRLRILFVLIFLFISTLCFNQNESLNKLKQAFGSERVNFLTTNYPDSIAYYNFVLQDGFRISEKKYLKEEEIAKALPLDLPENTLKNNIPQPLLINIFTLPVQFHPTQNMYYRINGTDYVLVIRSKDYLTKKFNAKSK